MTKKTVPLNDRQAEAVAHVRGPALVLAGAGSGKTRVITTRAVRLIESGVSPWAVFCVTFTNKAAAEMRRRICAKLGLDPKELWISTFHSACLRILKSEYKTLGYPSMPVVFDAADQKSLVRTLIKQKGMTDADLPYRRVLGLISKYKSNMKGPDEMAADIHLRDGKVIAEVFHLYQSGLKENNGLDFDDILLEVIRLFKNNKTILESYRRRFEFVMVDEFQDTNKVQYRILKLLAGSHHNIFVVGDDDQSIYRWRGANIKNILGFDKDFPNCKTYKLEENYRSTGNILEAAGSVVKAVGGRKEKTLWTKKESGEPVTVRVADDEWKEAEFVAREILRKVDAGEAAWSDFAIFYRTNAQSRVIEECFNLKSIPHRIYGGLKFYARKEIKDIIAYLRLAINDREEISFLRAAASPPRGIGSVSIGKLRDFAAKNSLSLLNASAREPDTLPSTARKKLKQFHDLIKEIKQAIDARPASEVVMLAVEKSGCLHALLSKKTAQDNSRAENLKELASAPYKNETLTEFLERTALVADADEVDESAATVSLMTLHVSKGLEFPVVFMVGMEENLFPHANSMGSVEEIDEERRLCYVGMTRARKKLFMTCAARRRFLGNLSFNNPSIFLDDLPEEIVEIVKPGAGMITPAYQPAPKHIADPDGSAGGFNVGMVVKHPRFGPGVIRKREGDGDDMNLTVKFQTAGVKKLKQKYARLTLA